MDEADGTAGKACKRLCYLKVLREREAAGTEGIGRLLVKNLRDRSRDEKDEKRFCRLEEKMYIVFP